MVVTDGSNAYPFYAPIIGSWFILFVLIAGSILASYNSKARDYLVTYYNNKVGPIRAYAYFYSKFPIIVYNIIGYIVILFAVLFQIAHYFNKLNIGICYYWAIIIALINLASQLIFIEYLRRIMLNRDSFLARVKFYKQHIALLLLTKRSFTIVWIAFAIYTNLSTIIEILYVSN